MEEKVNVNIEAVQAENEMLKKQLGQAYAQLRDKEFSIMLSRMDFLFKVLERQDCFDSDFIIKVSDEIKDMLYPKENNKEE